MGNGDGLLRSTAHLFIAREQKSRTGHNPRVKPYPIRPTQHDIYIKQDRQGPRRGGGGLDASETDKEGCVETTEQECG